MENGILTSWIALSIGFLHALEPGHGKTALFTFLASGKKSIKDGIVISISSALTHSATVFFIAFISHYLFHHTLTEKSIHLFSSYAGFISGGIICFLGFWVIFQTKKGKDLHANCCSSHSHSHPHHHSHHHDEPEVKKGNFLTSSLLGIATGIIPCPTVIVAYMSGVSSGNSYLGIQSVIYFGLGMFLSLMGVILLFNFGGQKLIEKLKSKKTVKFNWGYIQGFLFIFIGLFTGLYH